MTVGSNGVRPNRDAGWDTKGLREDPRQWIIYHEAAQEAVVRAIQTAALQMVGQHLAKHPEMQVRAIGTLMLKMADVGVRTAFAHGGDRQTAMEHLSKTLAHVYGQAPIPLEALDDLWATVYQIDHRMNSAGIRGTGFLRDLIRGD